jgi:flagellar hook-length control protein FliK
MPTVSPAPTQSTAEVAPSAASSGSPGQAPTDFMLALAQMLGGGAPTAVAAQVVVAATQEPELDIDTQSSEEAAALALLPLPILPPQGAIVPPQLPVSDADPLELLGLNPRPESANARDTALLQAMAERLAASEPAATPETQTATFMPSIDTQQPVRASADGAITRPVHVPVGTPAWADEIGSRLTMMTEKGQHTASLRMSPEHLGPLEIRIAMRDDQASVWFGAAHADTRAAIEHALPRLRELFAAQGMSLTDAGVFREPPRQQMPTFANDANAGTDSANESASVATQVKVGLVDAYA